MTGQYLSAEVGGLSVINQDFNTSPDDMTYMALTRRPLLFESAHWDDMKDSLGFNFEDEDEETPEGEEVVLKFRSISDSELEEKINSILGLYAEIPALRSLYAMELPKVQPSAVGIKGEPKLTNCAARFKNCLDYIFLLPDETNDVSVESLLCMPTAEELKSGGQDGLPRVGILPSDHFALMVRCNIRSRRKTSEP
jgi:mRNA deadenylase 3'-5' endonuclease subunit Ccr4